ncbi:CAF17-like 4Fe-4S cluster assembly/insertion protein YgfZ [Salinibius halmophilus]|uniref:CAF17-like 4Fe-4S cluster assembly/insertion protein YgfZ n=1 Tax=Salinibius halmophilus TaxID=1853216 RepID=UPI000E6665A8|nr:folate-binding protein YgfZ [Salinibius halmophilus]
MLIDRQPNCRTLQLTGDGVEALLHGQTTCEVRNLSESQGVIGALCNPKGRMISQFLIHKQGDTWFLTMHESLYDITLARLKKYGVFYKVDFGEFESGHSDIYFAQLDNIALPPGQQWQMASLNGQAAMQIDQAGKLWRVFGAIELAGEETNLTGAWLEAGIALLTLEETETLLPQALGMADIAGIDFKKGCYTGQEIVARVHYKGKVKHQLARFSAEQPVLENADIVDDLGKQIGKVFRSATLQSKHWVLGLIAETDAISFSADAIAMTRQTDRFH